MTTPAKQIAALQAALDRTNRHVELIAWTPAPVNTPGGTAADWTTGPCEGATPIADDEEGIPTHFSLDVPKRAHQLLLEQYEKLPDDDGTKFPLKATFLLSVSMPIVILPFEHILKYKRQRAEGHMNDAVMNPSLENAIDLKRKVREAEFFTGLWQYARLERGAGCFPNLASLPDAVAEQLDAPKAIECARSLSAYMFCRILRNALAHGGVLYLDQNGRSNTGAPVRCFAFVSTDRSNQLHFLRIETADYRAFLHHWVDWLKQEVLADLGLDDPDTETVSITEAAANAASD